ncbi:MFS transporter [Klebsiella pneumoniae]|uniref:MFS transporter n=1 Tax=Klebsiella pneumoniae TaxID=573 RepID=UPI001ABBE896|nr:MFS transporter [Klebsiella pneumoniae]MBO3721275.1 MFS transporter [Klebsiella pneumoniae]HCM5830603.1 MFS transporter [Klebsiella pneumoniae]
MQKVSTAGGFTLLAIASLTIMVGCVIVPGLPLIASNLHVEKASGWLVTLPALGVVLFGPLTAKIIQRVGLHRTLCLGLFWYGALGVLGAFLSGYLLLLIDRLLLGGATALVMTAGTGLISEFYQGSQRLKMIALQGMSIELGGVIFLFLGGVLSGIHWASPFCLYSFAWFLLAMLILLIPKTNEQKIMKPKMKSKDNGILPAIKITWGCALGSMIVFFTAIIMLPLRLTNFEISPYQTGMFLSFISFVAVCAAWFMPKIVSLTSEKNTLIVAFLCYTIGHCIFYLTNSLEIMISGAIALGFGFGLSVPLVNHIIISLSSSSSRGANLAKLSMAIFSGQFMSSLIIYIPGNQNTGFKCAVFLSLFVVIILIFNKMAFSSTLELDSDNIH